MSYLLFVDESGHDQGESPYEVLAGVSVEDKGLWPLIQAIHKLELECFGQRYAQDERELKAKKLLKRKVFRHAAQLEPFPVHERRPLAQACLEDGPSASKEQITALAQAKLAFVKGALKLCADYQCKAFASIVARGAPRLSDDKLRKDYAYLFERFFYFVERQAGEQQGLVVFDELERTQSHLLVAQMEAYFLERQPMRSRVVIPEPFFVHSHLTTGVQLADLTAYVAAWGLQVGNMPPAERQELSSCGEAVRALEHHVIIDRGRFSRGTSVHSLCPIDDLRPRRERTPGSRGRRGKARPRK